MGLRHELKRATKKTKDELGSLFDKHEYRKAFRHMFGDSTGKKIWNYVSNPFRAAQRSHRFGHTTAPSYSEKNLVTRAYNSVMNSFSKSAMRAAQRQIADKSGNSGYTASQADYSAMSPSVTQHLDYSYRRLSDIV